MLQKSGKVTINDIAKNADVSKTTVSRFINGRFEFMSEETRNRIEAVIEDLDYRPNSLARGLKSNKSGVIGAIIADITSPFSSILLKGVGDYCQEKGYQIMIANTDNDPGKERDYVQSLIANQVEGLIINTTGDNSDYLITLAAQGMPIVLADRAIDEPKFDTVMSDNYAMTYRTVKHLFDSGFQRVAFFTEEVGKISSRSIRRDAFIAAAEDCRGINAKDDVYVVNSRNQKMVLDAIHHFYQQDLGAAKAIFAVNGVTLLCVLQGLSQLDLAMPDDMGVCGYDDWGWAALIPPGITVISQPSYQVGVVSAKLLIARIKAKRRTKPKVVELPADLIIRGSTKLCAPKS